MAITQTILQNADLFVMRQDNYDNASMFAYIFMAATFNPNVIKAIQERPLMLGDQELTEQRYTFYTPQEQHTCWCRWFMNLGVGEGFAKFGTIVRFCQIVPTTIPNIDIETWRQRQPWITKPGTTSSKRSWTLDQSQSDTWSSSGSSPQSKRRTDEFFD